MDNYLTVDGDFPEKLYDLTQLEQISRGNDAFVKKMVSIFINQTQDSLATIENNIEENNLENISRIAHKIKPSIDQMGIILLKNDIRALESYKMEKGSSREFIQLARRVSNVLKTVLLKLESDGYSSNPKD